MKKMVTTAALISLLLPVMVQATEFQPIGALGMGGAGVARQNGALTAYWNPAGGAFNDSPFVMHLGVGVGARGSDGLAENVDRFQDINFDNVKNFNTTTADAKTVGDMVKAVTLIDDIAKRQGNIAINSQVPVGFAIKHFSFGVFGNLEGSILPKADTSNVLPNTVAGSTVINTTSVTDLYNAAIKGQPANILSSNAYFSDSQTAALATSIFNANSATAPITLPQATQLANVIGNQFSGSNIPASTTLDSLTNTLLPALKSGGTNTFDKNTTSALTKAIEYIEVPLSYGYPIDLGTSGKLAIGATAKIISGTVYQNQVLLVNRPGGGNTDSKDLIKDMTKNSKASVNFGIDLGALYKYDSWLSAGIVAKNLNSPKFDAPDYDAPVDNNPAAKVKKRGEDVTLKPQVRAGVAVTPFDWLIVAADLDLTDNETLAPGTVVGSSVKSRNLGGGFELHPYSWLRLRGGAYKNLSNSEVGLVLTTGFTLFVLDVDGAFATDTFKVGGSTIPQEAKVQVALSFAF